MIYVMNLSLIEIINKGDKSDTEKNKEYKKHYITKYIV
jgi:hypothetical protein